MSTRVIVTLLAAALLASACQRLGVQPSVRTLRSQVATLERERDALRQRIDAHMAQDARLAAMPEAPVRISVPTSLVQTFVEALAAGFGTDVGVELEDVKARKSGDLKKVFTLGHYDLWVTIDEVRGTLHAGRPEIGFGGNQVSLRLPVTLASGEGTATLRLLWNGTGLSDALCGDIDIRQPVSGRVQPQNYLLQGNLVLTATSQEILGAPRFPPTKLRLAIEPSAESWRALQKILDEKQGMCGFVVGKLDVPGLLRGVLDKGITVRLPLEKIPSFAVPIAVSSTIDVQGKPVALGVRLAGLVVQRQALSLGVSVAMHPPAAGAPVGGRTARSPW